MISCRVPVARKIVRLAQFDHHVAARGEEDQVIEQRQNVPREVRKELRLWVADETEVAPPQASRPDTHDAGVRHLLEDLLDDRVAAQVLESRTVNVT